MIALAKGKKWEGYKEKGNKNKDNKGKDKKQKERKNKLRFCFVIKGLPGPMFTAAFCYFYIPLALQPVNE
jgi:hypothetical protein